MLGAWPGPYAISKNNQLFLLDFLEKEYKISFEVFISQVKTDLYQSLIHFTLGGNHDKYGDRIPAVWITNNKAVHITSAISGHKNSQADICCVKEGEWIKMEISQTLKEGKVQSILISIFWLGSLPNIIYNFKYYHDGHFGKI